MGESYEGKGPTALNFKDNETKDIMPREINADATYLYAARVTNKFIEQDGTIKTSVRVWGPYDSIRAARTQFNQSISQLRADEASGILGPQARPRWTGYHSINVDRTVEMVRTKVNFEEESTW